MEKAPRRGLVGCVWAAYFRRMPDLGNPRDRWLPFILFCGCAAFLVLAFLNRDNMETLWLFVGTAMFAFLAGGLFMMWTRREP
jgi:hypothetical protein